MENTEKKPFTFEVTGVSRLAWNDQQVDLKSEDTTLTIHLKNPEDHDSFVKGSKVTLYLEDAE